MQAKSTTRRRGGMAPLEFVLVLPLLAGLLYLLFAVAKDTISKCTVIEQSRYETWKRIPSANPAKPLAVRTPAEDGEIHFDASRSITHTGALNQTFTVDSKNRTTARRGIRSWSPSRSRASRSLRTSNRCRRSSRTPRAPPSWRLH